MDALFSELPEPAEEIPFYSKFPPFDWCLGCFSSVNIAEGVRIGARDKSFCNDFMSWAVLGCQFSGCFADLNLQQRLVMERTVFQRAVVLV